MAEQEEESFGSLLRTYRALANLSQEQLAERSGLSVHAVSMLEREIRRSPRPRTVELLADALQLDARRRRKLAGAARPRGSAPPRTAQPIAQAGPATAMRALPRDVASFTGREGELELLLTTATESRDSDRVVGICAINGMAGVGKTAFAVHAAHLLASAYPDGQLFLDLHAHAPGQRPATAAEALGTLLLTMGVAPEQVPNDEEARMTLWRDCLAGRRVLLVLDDAASHHQVRPLLPGSAGCLVLVTSRRRLTGLEDVEPLTLGPLPPERAADLFLRMAGVHPASAERSAVGALMTWCGCLPLAIRLLATKLRSHPAWTIRHLADRLEHTQDRLAELRVDDIAVRAAFELSYQDLTPDQQRLFRRLGLHPGREVDAYAASALDGIDLAGAREGLESLYDHHLVEEPRAGRYQLHDLLAAFARSLAARDAHDVNEAAIDRLLRHYLHLTARAARHFAQPAHPVLPPVEGEACHLPDLSTRERALALLDVESANLGACVEYASSHGRPATSVGLARAMQHFLLFSGRWDQALAVGRTALEASTVVGDRLSRAHVLYDLGVVQGLTSRYREAIGSLTEALAVYRDAGTPRQRSAMLQALGRAQYWAADYAAAAASLTEALAISRDLGERREQANALHTLGVLQRLTDQYAAASASLSEAFAIFKDLDDRTGQATALQTLGAVQHLAGAHPAARASLAEALRVFRELGHRRGQAVVLVFLGSLQSDAGEYSEAATSLTEAVRICRGLGTRHGLANSLAVLANVRRQLGDPNAADALSEAHAIYRDIGHRRGEGFTFQYLGLMRHQAGDRQAAADLLLLAATTFRDVGNRHGEAAARNHLGAVLLDSGRPADSLQQHREALRLAREIGTPLEEARGLEGMGRCLIGMGAAAEGVASLERALSIYRRLGVPEAPRTAATIAGLGASVNGRRADH